VIIVVDQDYIGHVVHFPSRTPGAGAVLTKTNVDAGRGVSCGGTMPPNAHIDRVRLHQHRAACVTDCLLGLFFAFRRVLEALQGGLHHATPQ